ncbi:ABC transporter permease [Eubacteriales bacterium OttesenSCG-928-K08]|nr:ABC transporter permease [Eubacteriales bacterium OttesenSCG-928-K08]
MTKLISAGFSRLRLSKIFWLGMVFMLVIAMVVVVNQYYSCLKYGFEIKLDGFVLGFTIIVPVLAAVFCSLFLGTEYSDGTMRNKLMIGHSRAVIYLSSLIISITATLLMCLAFLLGVCAVGIPLLGGLTTPLPHFFIMLLGSVVLVCAVCAILTVICMLISNKAIIAIVSILCMVGLLLLAISIDSRLQEPEFYSNVVFTENGTVHPPDELIPNPAYLTGAKRAVYEYAYDILPTGQALQYSRMSAEHLWQMPLYSLAILFLSTWLGVFFFKRKDLR